MYIIENEVAIHLFIPNTSFFKKFLYKNYLDYLLSHLIFLVMGMVNIIALTLFIFIGLSCEKNVEVPKVCLKGKLVLKGICMNYVIEVVEGNIDPSFFEKQWINPMTKVEYKNVFGLASICTFPENIIEGQEFYFSVLDKPDTSVCIQCKAYSPVPDKKLYITICNTN